MFTCVALLSAPKASASTKVIYSLAGDEDGEYTDTDLVIDSAGNVYGSSVLGGDFGSGTVFRLTLPAPAELAGALNRPRA